MRKEVLLALAERWEKDALPAGAENGSKESEIPNAVNKGIREGKRECADGLRTLIEMLG
jgi:hypothetical protein